MLIVVGLVLVITSIQNTYAALGAQLKKDFSGSQGFIVWMLALIAVGALGYVQGWEKFSRWFLALILIAIILANSKRSTAQGGLFGSLLQQVKNPVAPPAGASTGTLDNITGITSGSQGLTIAGSQIVPKSDPTKTWLDFGSFGTINRPSTWIGN